MFLLSVMNEPLWARRKFFDSYGTRPYEQQANLPPRGVRFSCPCCGYPTLGGRGECEICVLCSWEDDGQDAADADEVRGGPNKGYSLTEAQQNFETYLVKYPPADDTRIGGPDSEKVKELKGRLIATFEEMMKEPSAEELNLLWREVARCERGLYLELKRSIAKHSQRSIHPHET